MPTKGAIMRSLPVHHNKNFDTASDMQEESMEKQEDAIEENVDKRLKEKKQGDLLVSIHNISEKYNKAVNDAMGQFGYDQKTNKEVAERLRKQKLQLIGQMKEVVVPQIQTLDNYIAQLSKSTRFKNVKGPLYDPNTGWNPGYRVFASDLKSIIPLNAFEALHKKADIAFGQPAEAEANSIGFMPFTWIQNGVKMSVHPILYELSRAKAIREIYGEVLKMTDGVSFWTGKALTLDTKELAKEWQQWNYALYDHDVGDYDEYAGGEDNVLFKDRFGKFL